MLTFNSFAKIAETAEKWYRTDGSAKTRTPTETMIMDAMKRYDLDLEEAAKIVEGAILFYKNEHVVGGKEAYWEVVKKMKEAEAIVGSCKPTADFQVLGACSDLKKKKKVSYRQPASP